MSGESPREEKLVVRHCGINAERPYRTMDDGVVIGVAITATQTSRQQLTACEPLGQQGLCELLDGISAEVWQSAGIDEATAADAAMDPCRPRASSTIQTMS